MQWSDITKPPSVRTLRQFAGLCLVLFGGLGGWRLWHGQVDAKTVVLAVLGFGVGLAGLAQPRAIRHVFTGWMIAAFPIGWTVSRVVLGVAYYGLFTPVAAVFRWRRRDLLERRRRQVQSYWTGKPGARDVREYFRQY